MSQVSSYSVADGSGLSVRGAINAILGALASSNSGTGAPSTPIAGQMWCDTSTSPRTLKVYDDVSASWIPIAYLESNGVWALVEPQADLRYLKLAGGTLTGALAGTSASFTTSVTVNGVSVDSAAILTSGLISPARLASGTASSGVFVRGDGTWAQVAFSNLSGSIANGQVPSGSVTQWQASLSIAWGQITGTKNADELQGYTVSTGYAGSTIALRDGGGYLWAQYFNQGSGQNENPAISQIAVNNGQDGFWRKAGFGYFIQSMYPTLDGRYLTTSSFPFSAGGSGYAKFPNGLIVQWGAIYLGDIPANGTVSGTAYFPLAFPNGLIGLATDSQDANGGLGSYVWNTTAITNSYVSFGAHEVINVLQHVYFRYIAIGY